MPFRLTRHWRRLERVARPVVLLTDHVVDGTVTYLQQAPRGGGPHEGIVYWAGRSTPDVWTVTTCIAPEAATSSGGFETSPAGNGEVIMFLARYGLELLAQIHSHPGRFVDHSDGDDTGALMPYENYLSIVVPEYARRGIADLRACGIHRFERSRFRRLSQSEVAETLCVVPSMNSFRRSDGRVPDERS
jgi:proteasome lid subunit RPN8/RPN11